MSTQGTAQNSMEQVVHSLAEVVGTTSATKAVINGLQRPRNGSHGYGTTRNAFTSVTRLNGSERMFAYVLTHKYPTPMLQVLMYTHDTHIHTNKIK